MADADPSLEERLAVLETDMRWVREKLRSLDSHLGDLVAGIVITILLVILR